MESIIFNPGFTAFVVLLLQSTTAASQSTSASESTLGLSALAASPVHNLRSRLTLRDASGVKIRHLHYS